jgi:hypothetical protein
MADKPHGLRTSRYWRDRAEEARQMAGEMRSGDTEVTMLDIACVYDGMAERAARRKKSIRWAASGPAS